jgi:predicted RNase H-like HicB family nuclease
MANLHFVSPSAEVRARPPFWTKFRLLAWIKLEGKMNFTIEQEQEADGRWLAEVLQLPGVLAYGATSLEAVSKVEILALRVIAERLEHYESRPFPINISIPIAA